MDEIFRICDRITVLRDGETIGTLDIAATTPAEIIRLMVGRDLDSQRTSGARRAAKSSPVDDLRTAQLDGVSFDLRRGEVLGVAGLVGSGRSELGAALFGLDRDPRRHGRPRRHASACSRRIARLEGLMMDMSVIENGTLAVLPPCSASASCAAPRSGARSTPWPAGWR